MRDMGHIDSVAVAGAYRHVGPVFAAGLVEPREVFGVVGEVSVHFEHVVVAVVERPAESGHVGCPEAHLAGALDQEQSVGPGFLERFHHVGRPVGGAVVDDQNVVASFEAEYG